MTPPSSMRSTRALQVAHLIVAMLAAVVIASVSGDWLGLDEDCEPGRPCPAAIKSPEGF